MIHDLVELIFMRSVASALKTTLALTVDLLLSTGQEDEDKESRGRVISDLGIVSWHS